jgi:hypothetical protein
MGKRREEVADDEPHDGIGEEEEEEDDYYADDATAAVRLGDHLGGVSPAVQAILDAHRGADCMLVKPGSSGTLLIYPGAEPGGVRVLDTVTEEEQVYAGLEEAFRDDPRLRLSPGAEMFLGDLEAHPYAFEYWNGFRFRAEDWVGVEEATEFSDDRNWVIRIEQDQETYQIGVSIGPGLVADRTSDVPAGWIINFDWYDGATGVEVDDRGLVWSRCSYGVGSDALLGVATEPLVGYACSLGFSDGDWLNSIPGCEGQVWTDFLSRAEMTQVLRWLVEQGWIDLDLWLGSGIQVSIRGEEVPFDELIGRSVEVDGVEGDEDAENEDDE